MKAEETIPSTVRIGEDDIPMLEAVEAVSRVVESILKGPPGSVPSSDIAHLRLLFEVLDRIFRKDVEQETDR